MRKMGLSAFASWEIEYDECVVAGKRYCRTSELGQSNNLEMRAHYPPNATMMRTAYPSVFPVWMRAVQSSYAGAYTRSVNSRMNARVRARPVAGPYCSAVARLTPPSSGSGLRGYAFCRRVVLAICTYTEGVPWPKGKEEVGAGEGRASENASAGRTSAETLVKGKYSGLGMPAGKTSICTSVKQKDHLPPEKVIMSLSKYFWRSLSGEGAYLRT